MALWVTESGERILLCKAAEEGPRRLRSSLAVLFVQLNQELVGAAQLAVMPLSLTAEAMAVTISWDHFDGMQFHRVRAAPLGTSG